MNCSEREIGKVGIGSAHEDELIINPAPTAAEEWADKVGLDDPVLHQGLITAFKAGEASERSKQRLDKVIKYSK